MLTVEEMADISARVERNYDRKNGFAEGVALLNSVLPNGFNNAFLYAEHEEITYSPRGRLEEIAQHLTVEQAETLFECGFRINDYGLGFSC